MIKKWHYLGTLPLFLSILWLVFASLFVMTLLATSDTLWSWSLMAAVLLLLTSITLFVYLAFTAARITDSLHTLFRKALGEGDQSPREFFQDIETIGQAAERYRLGTQEVLSLVREDAEKLLTAAENLSQTSRQAEQATAQIATTIQQVASGSSETSQSAEKTAKSVQTMGVALSEMSAGIQNQANAVSSATKVIEKIIGRSGASAKVRISAQKVRDLVDQAEKINSVIDTIAYFSLQTNLLSINAAIETSHAETQSVNLPEIILNQQMVAQARLLGQIVGMSGVKFTTAFWAYLAKRANIDTLCITNKEGVIVHTNEESILGWKFPDDPKSQAFIFRKLIHQADGVVCQPPEKRSFDDRTFKYVGVSRTDEPGIVQVAFDVDTLTKFRVQLGGFKVIADEIRQLAGRSKEATNQIADIVKAMRVHIDETVILTGAAFDEMDSASSGLSEAINRVSRVVTEKQRAISEIEAASADIMMMVENVSAVSEENNASSEEVSASAGELDVQVEEVSASARSLQQMALALRKAVEAA